MALWLVRAGKHGEYEERFFSEGRIYLTWYISADMTGTKGKRDVKPLVVAAEKGASAAKVANHTGQIWAFWACPVFVDTAPMLLFLPEGTDVRSQWD